MKNRKNSQVTAIVEHMIDCAVKLYLASHQYYDDKRHLYLGDFMFSLLLSLFKFSSSADSDLHGTDPALLIGLSSWFLLLV